MSTVRANNYYDASGGSNAQLYGVASPPNSMGFRNRLINGAMVIDQRNAGASISFPPGDGNYCLDRWRLQRQGAGTMTVQQVTSAPTGFTNAIRFTVTGTSTPSAADFYTFGQVIEGFNAADLMWGTASAQSVTLSFWINSSVTGTYSASLYNTGSVNAYPATFTVNAANTWEYKTITIPGDTAGTWATTNAGSIYFRIDLGSGSNYSTATANAWNTSGAFRTNSSVNFISNASATLNVTGVQLEVGTVASAFERRDYGRELMMCQRYFKQINGSANYTAFASGVVRNPATNFRATLTYNTMRAAPTITFGGTILVAYGAGDNSGVTLSITYAGTDGAILDCAIGAGATTGSGGILYTNNNATGFVNLSSEL